MGMAKLQKSVCILRGVNSICNTLLTSVLSATERLGLLGEIKLCSRNKTNAKDLSSPEALKALCSYAFSKKLSSAITLEALRSLANILFLYPSTQQLLVDLGHGGDLVDRLGSSDWADQFVAGRILFLLTYQSKLNFEILIDERGLAKTINEALLSHAKYYSRIRSPSRKERTSEDDSALSEVLKLLFNITHYLPDRVDAFSKSIPPILKIMCRMKTPSPCLQAPMSYLLNALLNLDLEDKRKSFLGFSPLFPKSDIKCNADRMIDLLSAATIDYADAELDNQVVPLVTVMRRVYGMAPDVVKRLFKSRLLPTDEDREQVLGKSNSLSSRLLKLSTSPVAPRVRDQISALLFELSDSDASELVRNIGYGFASGFLMNKQIAIPQDALEAHAATEDEPPDYITASANAIGSAEAGSSTSPSTGARRQPTDAITGQLLSAKQKLERLKEIGPEMTEDEKIREAEKLFVLFERLKKNGIIKVANPVETAIQEGRFEELD